MSPLLSLAAMANKKPIGGSVTLSDGEGISFTATKTRRGVEIRGDNPQSEQRLKEHLSCYLDESDDEQVEPPVPMSWTEKILHLLSRRSS